MIPRFFKEAFRTRVSTKGVILCLWSFSLAAHGQLSLDTRQTVLGTRMTTEVGPSAQDAWELNRVSTAQVDRLGQIWVPDETEKQIRIFAQNGRLMRTVGGKGSGPGAFQQFFWLQALGDTMWVCDPRLSRLTSYTIASGTLLKSTRPSAVEARTFGLSSVGRLIERWSEMTGPSELKPLRIDLVHDQPNASRTFASVLRTHPVYWARIYDRREPPPPPEPKQNTHGLQIDQVFDDSPLYRLGNAGRSVVLVERSGLPSSGFRIVEIATNGDTLAKRFYPAQLVPLTDGQVSAAVDSISRSVSEYANPNLLASTSDIRAALFRPKFWPAVLDFHVGIDGSIWLLQPPTVISQSRYWRVDKDGRTLPPVALDAGLRVLQVSHDRVWVVKESTDGLPAPQLRDQLLGSSGV